MNYRVLLNGLKATVR